MLDTTAINSGILFSLYFTRTVSLSNLRRIARQLTKIDLRSFEDDQ